MNDTGGGAPQDRESRISSGLLLCERLRCGAPASRRAEEWFQFPRDPVRYATLCEHCFWEMLGGIEKHGRMGGSQFGQAEPTGGGHRIPLALHPVAVLEVRVVSKPPHNSCYPLSLR